MHVVTEPSPLRDEAIEQAIHEARVNGLTHPVVIGVDAALSVTREHVERLIREHGGCDDDGTVTLPQDAVLALLGEEAHHA